MLWKQEASRKANAFFDGVLPPFSNIGNTERGTINDSPTLRGIGQFALISCSCGISTAHCVLCIALSTRPHHTRRSKREPTSASLKALLEGVMIALCPRCLRSVHSTVKTLARVAQV